jgi:hypothetical protein
MLYFALVLLGDVLLILVLVLVVALTDDGENWKLTSILVLMW